MRKTIRLAALALASAMTLAAGTVSADKLKVGFIYIGPPGDHGWTYAHDQGRLMIDNMLGDHVETTFVEGVPGARMLNAPLPNWLRPATS